MEFKNIKAVKLDTASVLVLTEVMEDIEKVEVVKIKGRISKINISEVKSFKEESQVYESELESESDGNSEDELVREEDFPENLN